MLTPHQMSSAIITGPNELLEAVIKNLHSLKILHIVEHSKNELADIGKPLESANRISEALVKVRSLIAAFKIKKDEGTLEIKNGMLEIESTAKKLGQELSAGMDELKKTEDIIAKNSAARHELEILKNIEMPLEAFIPYTSLAYFTGYAKDGVDVLKGKLGKATENFLLLSSIAKKRQFIVLFIEAKSQEQANSILKKAGFTPVVFTNIAGLKGSASGNLKKLEEEMAKLRQKAVDIKKRIEGLGNEHKGFLMAAEEFLSEQLEKAEAPLKFAATKNSFLIKGWIPTDSLKDSIERLEKAAKNRIFFHFEPAKKEEKVPVKLKNPKIAKPFEFFMDLYTMPSYREIDPTFIVFLTFPFLFGFMLGDFGYGLATLALFIAFRRLMPKAKNFFNILIFASLMTIFFGLLFGEFFGFEEIGSFHLPHILSRAEDINQLLYLAVAVGAFHLNIGLILGFANELRSHGFMAALFAKGAWFVLEAGVVLVVLSSLKAIILPVYAGIIVILLSAAMLFKGEGVRGTIEIPSLFSNMLSYARLMAIGLSSVVLAMIVNDSAKQFFAKGGFLVLAGILVLIIGHAINIMLGLLGSFLHSLRLHYVEFFTKFFHGGAEKYRPFGSRE